MMGGEVLGAIFPKLFWKWKFRPLYRRLDKVENRIKNHEDPGVRHYYAHTGPARSRLKDELARLQNIPEPQRTKAVIYFIGQVYLLALNYPSWLSRACEVNQNSFSQGRRSTLEIEFSWQASQLLNTLNQLISIYNKENSSNYTCSDFTDVPGAGLRDLLRFHEACLKAIETQRTLESLIPLSICHFEMDLTFARLELFLIELEAGTPYEEILMKFEHPRLTQDGQAPENMTDRTCETGVLTIDAVADMIQISCARAV
jgi:hypothetical protein